MKKKILILVILMILNTSISFASEPTADALYIVDNLSIKLDEVTLNLNEVTTRLDTLSSNVDDSDLLFIDYMEVTNRYVMLTFLVTSLGLGFIIGYMLGRKKD